MADDRDRSGEEGDVTSEVPAGFEADPPSYRSGRVRIIGAEPAGNAVHEVTGPVVEENPDMPHWNDAPTGQVPAILDRGNGDEQALAPPSWREEDSDWAAHEELFEPSMLSDEAPPVGSMMNNNNDIVDMERQPWLFDTDDLSDDDTLVIEPDRPPETPSPRVAPAAPYAASIPPPRRRSVRHVGSRPGLGRSRIGRVCAAGPASARPASAGSPPGIPAARPGPHVGRIGIGRPCTSGPASAAPHPPGRCPRWPSRSSPSPPPSVDDRGPGSPRPAWSPRCHHSPACGHRGRPASTRRAPTPTSGGTSGRNMQLAWGSGILLGVVALLCAHFGSVFSLVLITVVVLFAAAEAFAAFRTAKYHPATLLGLVAVLSLMIETYNKGVAALPLVLVMLVAASFVWYLARRGTGGRPGRRPVLDRLRRGLDRRLRLLRRAPARSHAVPAPPRRGLPAGRGHRHGGRRRRLAPGGLGLRPPPAGPVDQPQQDLGGVPGWRRRRRAGVGDRGALHPPLDHQVRPSCSASWWPWWHRSGT